jgi:LEA14-like dessication related protein
MQRSGVMRRLGVVAVLVFVAAASGCATLVRAAFKEPYVALRDVRVTGLGIEGGSLNVTLAVYNPNDFALETVKLTYQVLVDSTVLGGGETPRRYAMPQGDTTLVQMPVDFTYRGVGRAVQALFLRGTIPYRVRGELGVQTPLGTFTRPYDRTGSFSPR